MNKSKSLHDLSKNFSVLFVEDDDVLRKTTSELLEGLFKSVQTAADGKIGLSLYEKQFHDTSEYFDIVISDIQMPHMDGITLSKEIYKINKKQKLLIVSAYNDKKYFIDLIKIGVSGFIEKPLGLKQLLATLSDVCHELVKEKETFRHIELEDGFLWDYKLSSLSQNKEPTLLTANEQLFLKLLLENRNQKFTTVEIFDYIYKNDFDKEYTTDSIKGLLKRIRKKLPKELISSTPQLGYSINI